MDINPMGRVVVALGGVLPLLMFVLAAGGAFCLYASDGAIAALGLTKFRADYGQWCGPAFLVGSLYLLGCFIAWVWEQIGIWLFKRELARDRRRS